jgi:hypothetical protein
VNLVLRDDHLVAIVQVPSRRVETWHNEKPSEQFYVRAANSTEPLTGPPLIRYIREHFSG